MSSPIHLSSFLAPRWSGEPFYRQSPQTHRNIGGSSLEEATGVSGVLRSPSRTNEVIMFAALLAAALCAADKPAIECVDPDKDAGTSLAVTFDEAPLVHTGQLFPPPKDRS